MNKILNSLKPCVVCLFSCQLSGGLVAIGQVGYRHVRIDIDITVHDQSWTFRIWCAGFFCHRICRKARRHHPTGDNRHSNEPKRRFFVIQHIFHPFFYANLSKGQRANGHQPPSSIALQQSGGVLLLPIQIHLPDNLFVTGQLNVPAQQHIGYPAQGIEPVNGQDQKAQRLPPVVTPCQVRLFVGNYRPHSRLVHTGRQIDFGPDQPQDKRRLHIVAQKDVSLIGHSFRNALTHPHIADDCIEQHGGDANEPDCRHNKCPDIERVDATNRVGSKFFAQNGIDRIVDGGDAAADGGRLILDVMGVEGLGAGNQAQCALKGEGNH